MVAELSLENRIVHVCGHRYLDIVADQEVDRAESDLRGENGVEGSCGMSLGMSD